MDSCWMCLLLRLGSLFGVTGLVSGHTKESAAISEVKRDTQMQNAPRASSLLACLAS